MLAAFDAFNAACDVSLTVDEYAAAAAAAAGAPPPPVEAAAVALRNYENQGELDVTRARRELGWRPTPLAEWMRETVEWHAPLLDDNEGS